ncbi:MAG: amidohydrolase [Chloroflexota bacterium]|jgi:5-methylthioadenosine/S-adenosylhomocysteine deaminase
MPDLIVRNCQALLLTDRLNLSIQKNCDILIDDGQITDLRPTRPIQPGEAQQVIEADGMLAMPGFINTHAHAPMVIFRGLAEDVSIERWFNEFMWPLESNLQEEDVYWGMLLALAEMIESGVTTVADHYFFMDRAAEAVREAGTRAALGWAVFGDGGYEALEASASFAQRWYGQADGRITTWMAPHAPYTCDDNFLRASAGYARQLGIGIHIHAAEEMGQTEASLEKRGITPIQVLAETGVLEVPTLIAHGCGILPEDVVILAQADRVGVAHAPKTYLKLGMGLTPIYALRDAGIPVGLATDGAVSNNTLDILESLRLMAMMQKHERRDPEVMTIPEALEIAFPGSAEAIGLGDKIGRLAPGYLADLVLVDTNGAHLQPLHSITASIVYNIRPGDIQTVIVNGQVLMHDRQLLTLDKEEIIRQVNKSMERLAQRIPSKRIQVYNP